MYNVNMGWDRGCLWVCCMCVDYVCVAEVENFDIVLRTTDGRDQVCESITRAEINTIVINDFAHVSCVWRAEVPESGPAGQL